MAVKRIVDTYFWNDSKVTDSFSPEDKYFMLYLLTNPHTTQLGIYELSITKAANELGYSKEAVIVLLDRFQNEYDIIRYNKSTNEVAIKNFLRHSITKGGKPVMDCLLKEEKRVKDRSLLDYITDNLNNYKDVLNETVLGFVQKIELSKENTETASEPVADKPEKDIENIVKSYGFGDELYEVVIEWFKYKKEKKQSYKPIGMSKLLSEIKKNADKYGENDVIEIINKSMANNWQGIIFDKLKEKDQQHRVNNNDDDWEGWENG